MKPIKLLIYVIVLLALAAYVYFVEIKGQERKAVEKAEKEKLVSLEKDKIDQVVLKSKDKDLIRLRKTSGAWVMTDPVKSKADEAAIKTMLITLDKASLEKMISEKNENWSEYGLEDPDFTVEVKAGDGKTALLFGDKNPSGGSYYLRVKDDPRLTLVEDTLRNALDKAPIHYRDKTVVSLAPEDIDELSVKRQDDLFHVKKDDQGFWSVTAPEQFRARSNDIQGILRNLTNIKAEQIIDKPDIKDDEYGLDNPELLIIFKGAKPDQALEVGKEKQQDDNGSGYNKLVFARIKGQEKIFIIPKRVFDNVKTSRDDLEDRSLLSLRSSEIKDITVRYQEKTWKMVKKDSDKWFLESPKEMELKSWPVNNLLWVFSDLKWKSIETDNPQDISEYHLSNPDIMASFGKKGSDDEVVFKAGWKRSNRKGSTYDDNEKKAQNQSKDDSNKDEAGEQQPEGDVPPEKVFVSVKPHYKGNVIFTIDSDFLNRLKMNLEELSKSKDRK